MVVITRYWYRTHLPAFGFEILELTPNGNFSTYLMQELGRIPAIAERYTNIVPTLLERFGQRLVKMLLSRMISADNASQEFACFGYHVLARKRG